MIKNQPIKLQMVVFCCKIRNTIWGYPGFRATTQRHHMGISGIRSKQLRAPYGVSRARWVNMPCKSLKGILVLVEEEKSYVRDMSKFYNPGIQKVSITIEGKPNQLYSQGMRSFEQYDEARKYFAEGRLPNDVQAQLQLYDVSLGEYLVNKFALWLHFRMIDENQLQGMGRRIENASEGITLQIEKKAETTGLSMLTSI